MMLPDVDDELACLIDTIETVISPHVDDDYAASLCLTVAQVLRSVRARVAHEGQALHDDNTELRELLERLRAEVDAATVGQIDAALAQGSAAGGTSRSPSSNGKPWCCARPSSPASAPCPIVRRRRERRSAGTSHTSSNASGRGSWTPSPVRDAERTADR